VDGSLAMIKTVTTCQSENVKWGSWVFDICKNGKISTETLYITNCVANFDVAVIFDF